LCIKLVILKRIYTMMHGQKNIKLFKTVPKLIYVIKRQEQKLKIKLRLFFANIN